MQANTNHTSPNNFHSLIEKMHTEDKRNVRIMRNFKWMMWIMSPLYLLIFNLGPIAEISIYDRLGGLCFSLAFLIFAIIFTKYLKVYRSVDYGQPTVVMLTNAVKRYKMQLSKIALSLIPVVLINAGIMLISIGEEGEGLFAGHYLKFQLIYWTMMSVSMSIGYMIWRHKQKPLRDAALKLLNEFNK